MKKILLSFILIVMALGYAQASNPVKGIMCTYDGSETTYSDTYVSTNSFGESSSCPAGTDIRNYGHSIRLVK